MSDRQEPAQPEKPKGDKKLTLDKEPLRDIEPAGEDEDQVRGGRLLSGTSITCIPEPVSKI